MTVVGIESFSSFNPLDPKTCSSFLQRSRSGKYVQSFDELYIAAADAKPVLEKLLHDLVEGISTYPLQVLHNSLVPT